MEQVESTNVQLFVDQQFGELHVVCADDGQLWFSAKDICAALDIVNLSQAVRRLDDDEKVIYTGYTLGGTQQMLAVNECGMYTLVLSSRKKEAKAFKRWLTHDVLPTLRKTGAYVDPSVRTQMPEDELIDITSAAYNPEATPVTKAVAASIQESLINESNYQTEIATQATRSRQGVSDKESFRNALMAAIVPKQKVLKAAMLFINGQDITLTHFSSKELATLYSKFYCRIYYQKGIRLITRQAEATSHGHNAAKMDFILPEEWPGVFEELWGFGLYRKVDWDVFIEKMVDAGMLG